MRVENWGQSITMILLLPGWMTLVGGYRGGEISQWLLTSVIWWGSLLLQSWSTTSI